MPGELSSGDTEMTSRKNKYSALVRLSPPLRQGGDRWQRFGEGSQESRLVYALRSPDDYLRDC